MNPITDYRVIQARAHRLHSEALRADAEATRLFADLHMTEEHRTSMYASARTSEECAAAYDKMADGLESDIASDQRMMQS